MTLIEESKPNKTRFIEVSLSDVDAWSLAKTTALSVQSGLRVRVGAVLRKNGKTVAIAGNSLVNPPGNVPVSKISKHAEELVLSSVSSRVAANATLYICRVGKSDEPLNSRPCVRRCLPMILGHGVKTIVYAFDGYLVKERIN